MRPIKMTDKEKAAIATEFTSKLMEQLENYTFDTGNTVKFERQIGEKAKEKAFIVFEPVTYLRMKSLVKHFSTEVSWFGLVRRIEEEKIWYVYDVLTFKQQVNGAKVDTTDDDMEEFFLNLTDEQAEDLHFQAHSHVNMATSASGPDMQNQADILKNMPGQKGFYIFQIWNKQGDINTYLYDMDNNIFYDRNDIEIVVGDPAFDTLDNFLKDAESKVSEINRKNDTYKYGDYGYKNQYPYKDYYNKYKDSYKDYSPNNYQYGYKNLYPYKEYCTYDEYEDFEEEEEEDEFGKKL